MRIAIIVGYQGQDGRLLYDFLLRKGYLLIGIGRGISESTDGSWDKVIDIGIYEEVESLVRSVQPDEIYYLAGFHHSSEDPPLGNLELFQNSYATNVFPVVNFLEAIMKRCPKARFFYAATSHVFGRPDCEIQDETTPFLPNTIYGITKLDGLLICRYYRDRYRLFAVSGILYNHESHLRNKRFISKKIIQGAVNIRHGKQNKIVLGNSDAEVDWGFAPDYIEAMHMMINAEKPDDYIIATGKKHSVSEFVEIVFRLLNIDWKRYVEYKSDIVSRTNSVLIGDSAKIKRELGWQPSLSFEEMILTLINQELNLLDE